MSYIVDVLNKKDLKNKKPPIWIMRQAGRYLPEYREARSKAGSFLDLCYNPKLACEVTLQPIKRFNFDAAIIFSDILVIPHALGCDLKFIAGEGPKLSKISSSNDLKALKINKIDSFLKPVFEAVSLTRQNLSKDKALIGFAGCPWTLACYMIEGGGSKNFDETRKLAIFNQEFFGDLIDILTQSIIRYLSLKIEAGANIVKLFDSWAGLLPPSDLKKWVFEPVKNIVNKLKEKYPDIPIICFPKGIGVNYKDFVNYVNCDCVAVDQNLPRNWIVENLQEKTTIQGNLDNFLLAFGSKKEIQKEVEDILQKFSSKPFIFNLGHGILPQTPIENVEFLIDLVRM